MLSAKTTPQRRWLRNAQRGMVLVLCLALGLQWALLQGIAWTGMLISFAREGSVIEAVEKTFDGRHGCALCKTVKEGTQDSNNSDQGTQQDDAVKGLAAVLTSTTVLIPPAGDTISFAMLREMMVKRNELPETPPPRRGLA